MIFVLITFFESIVINIVIIYRPNQNHVKSRRNGVQEKIMTNNKEKFCRKQLLDKWNTFQCILSWLCSLLRFCKPNILQARLVFNKKKMNSLNISLLINLDKTSLFLSKRYILTEKRMKLTIWSEKVWLSGQ